MWLVNNAAGRRVDEEALALAGDSSLPEAQRKQMGLVYEFLSARQRARHQRQAAQEAAAAAEQQQRSAKNSAAAAAAQAQPEQLQRQGAGGGMRATPAGLPGPGLQRTPAQQRQHDFDALLQAAQKGSLLLTQQHVGRQQWTQLEKRAVLVEAMLTGCSPAVVAHLAQQWPTAAKTGTPPAPDTPWTRLQVDIYKLSNCKPLGMWAGNKAGWIESLSPDQPVFFVLLGLLGGLWRAPVPQEQELPAILQAMLAADPELLTLRWAGLEGLLATQHHSVVRILLLLRWDRQWLTALHCTALHCTALHCTALSALLLDAGMGRGTPLQLQLWSTARRYQCCSC